ncbi:hypothetical protein COE67_12105 [Priestia megaterium]|uniref:hypothetical protein n=1 Tax=Priestia megaterium TaxID=1404 RepID=UPI000494A26D|nr:hypothetical protein [Priestia megaterium]MDH6657050.1 hypothetical protein [Bacillus sp. PvP124]AQU76734.1 hypothetical protein BUW91_26225 [Priestia megaterium]MCU7766800.1 hypothetical protein [Priestia megaterium]PFP14506.1 hypothetical protein COJ90_07000 [Priestia megaterium]PGX41802.1 hypothetical protein COE67_12105 [Priestia megaterium]
MKRKLVLISGSKQTKLILNKQLIDLLGDYISIHCFAIDEGLPKEIEGDVVLYSSESIEEEAKEILAINSPNEIVGNRTIHYKHISQLLKIPVHTKITEKGLNYLYYLKAKQNCIINKSIY